MLEERLKAGHMAETESLHVQHQSELEELQFQQQEQVDTGEGVINIEQSRAKISLSLNIISQEPHHCRLIRN